MKIYNLRNFSKPEFLRKISPKLLFKFIKHFPGCAIAIKNDRTINYEMFALFLANPKSIGNTKLFDALCVIDEMSADIHFDLLQEIIVGKDYAPKMGEEASPADLALCVWLHEPWALEAAHAQSKKTYPKSFIYFRSAEVPDVPLKKPLGGQLKKLTKLLNQIFQRKRRGKTAKVNVFEEPGVLVYHSKRRAVVPRWGDSVKRQN